MALKNPINMGNINQQELQSLREIIGSHQTMATKFDFYSNQCQDQQIKQLLWEEKHGNLYQTSLFQID